MLISTMGVPEAFFPQGRNLSFYSTLRQRGVAPLGWDSLLRQTDSSIEALCTAYFKQVDSRSSVETILQYGRGYNPLFDQRYLSSLFGSQSRLLDDKQTPRFHLSAELKRSKEQRQHWGGLFFPHLDLLQKKQLTSTEQERVQHLRLRVAQWIQVAGPLFELRYLFKWLGERPCGNNEVKQFESPLLSGFLEIFPPLTAAQKGVKNQRKDTYWKARKIESLNPQEYHDFYQRLECYLDSFPYLLTVDKADVMKQLSTQYQRTRVSAR